MPTFIDSKIKKHDIALFNLFYIDSEMNCTFLIVDTELKIDPSKYYKLNEEGLKEIARKPKEEWIDLAYKYFNSNKDKYPSFLNGIPKEIKGNMLQTLCYVEDDCKIFSLEPNKVESDASITSKTKNKTKTKK